MRLLASIQRIPAGLMIIPLLLGTLVNTVDQLRLPFIQQALHAMRTTPAGYEEARKPSDPPVVQAVLVTDLDRLGGGTLVLDGAVVPVKDWFKAATTARIATSGSASVSIGEMIIAKSNDEPLTVSVTDARRPYYEMLKIGGFTQPLFKDGTMAFIALFLFIVGSQMNLRVGGRALAKGLTLTGTKFVVGVGAGYLIGSMDPTGGWMGLSTVVIIAALTNENGGMFVALTRQFGSRSDVGAISVLSFNDGPFLTLLGLGILGNSFPMIVFLAVLIPIVLGVILGNLDEDLRAFLAPGETLLIPFFAFALGAGLNLAVFTKMDTLLGGLVLAGMTMLLTIPACVLTLRLLGFRNTISAFATGTVAGNAALVPGQVGLAAVGAAAAGAISAQDAANFAAIAKTGTAQITIAVLTTALMVPLLCAAWAAYQRRAGLSDADDVA